MLSRPRWACLRDDRRNATGHKERDPWAVTAARLPLVDASRRAHGRMGRQREVAARRLVEAVRRPSLTGLTDRAMMAPSGVAGADQPRSHLRVTPPRQLSDREIRTASSPRRYRSAPKEGLFCEQPFA
jgi:hypothetical protein